jgi:hypothetical protein
MQHNLMDGALLQAFLLEDFWEQLVKVSESGHLWPHEDNKSPVG